MIKTYLLYEPDQQLLLPAALQEWLPDDHLAYFISDVVDQLDMSKVTARYERERRGGPPYHPRMMVKVLLYGYCVGVASSRRIAQRLHEDIAFRVSRAERKRTSGAEQNRTTERHVVKHQGPGGVRARFARGWLDFLLCLRR